MRKVRKHSLTLAAAAILLLLAVALTSVGAFTKPRGQTAPPASMPTPVMPMKLVAPLFIEDDATTSVITMVNSMAKPIDVDVILAGLDGNEIAKRTTTIDSHSVQQLAAKDLLQGTSVFGPAYGSVLLIPHEMSTLAAQMSIVYRKGSVSDIEEEFTMIMEASKPANFRAVANNLVAPPSIAIRSLSNQKRVITIDCLGKAEQQIKSDMSIEPNQTLLVQACMEGGAKRIADLNGLTYAQSVYEGIGLSVSSLAPAMEFAVFGLGIQGNQPDRHLRAIQFTDVNQLNSSTAIYPGAIGENSLLGIHASELRVSVANFGESPRKATVSVSKGSGNNNTRQQIATINVPPRSAVARNLAEELPDHLGLDSSLIVQSDAAIGETLSDIQLLSRPNDGLSASVQLPWKDQAQGFNGGQHPWRIDGGFTSTVLLFNPDQHEANSIKLYIFSENKTWAKVFSIPPSATLPVRLNDIISKEEKDDKGKTLPPTSTSGLVYWFTLRNPKIFGQLVQTDWINGVVRPFACSSLTVVCGGTINSILVLSGQTNSANGTAQDCGSCGGCSCADFCGSSSGSGWFSNWSVNDTSIAQLTNSNTLSATFQGVNPGSTYSNADVSDNNGCIAGATSGNIDVAPALNSISPAQGPVSSTTSGTLNGNGFGSICSNLSFSAGSGVTVTCNSVSNTQIQASFAISASAASGNHAVSVTVNGKTSPSVNFFVQIPARLVFFNTPPCAPNGQGGLQNITDGSSVVDCGGVTRATNFCGVNRNLTYQLVDQSATANPFPLAYTISESFSNLSTTNPALGLPAASQNVPIAANGIVTDAQFVGFTYPTCLGTNDHHSYTQNFSVNVGGVNYNLSTTVSISNGNFSGAPQDNVNITTP